MSEGCCLVACCGFVDSDVDGEWILLWNDNGMKMKWLVQWLTCTKNKAYVLLRKWCFELLLLVTYSNSSHTYRWREKESNFFNGVLRNWLLNVVREKSSVLCETGTKTWWLLLMFYSHKKKVIAFIWVGYKGVWFLLQSEIRLTLTSTCQSPQNLSHFGESKTTLTKMNKYPPGVLDNIALNIKIHLYEPILQLLSLLSHRYDLGLGFD